MLGGDSPWKRDELQALNRASEDGEGEVRGGKTLQPSPAYSFTKVSKLRAAAGT